MNTSPRLPSAPLCQSIALLLAVTLISDARAAVFEWDADLLTPGVQPGGGLWNPTDAHWISGGSNTPWVDGNDATFGGADGDYEITVQLDPTANSLVFNNSGYELSAADPHIITVTSTSAAVSLAAGKTATIGNNVTIATPVGSQNSAIVGAGTLIIESGGTIRNRGTASTNILNINSTTVEVRTGGTLTAQGLTGGNGNAIFINGTVNVLGGTVNAPGTLGLGQSSAAGTTAGTLTITSGTVSAPSSNGIRIGATSGTTPGGTVNLDGGTLSVMRIFRGSANVTNSIVNLNGGILQATATSGDNFLQSLSRVNVRDGGAIIDTNGRALSFSQPLLHSNIGGDNATDGGLTKNGAGSLTMTGANTYTGGTTINGGLLTFGATALPASGTVLINSGGALSASGPFSTITDWLNSARISTASTGSIALAADSAENVSLGAYADLFIGASADAIFTGTLTPNGGVYRLGGGGAVLTLANTNALTGANALVVGAPGMTGTVALASTNDYTGGTTLRSGTLAPADDASLGAPSGALNFNGGTLRVANPLFTSTARTINWGAEGGTFEVFSGNVFTVGQALGAGGGLTKGGAGTLILSGTNSYTGTTTLTNGVLEIASSGALGASTLTAGNGQTQVHLSGNITVPNAIRLGTSGLAADGILKNLSGNNTLTDFGFTGTGGTRIHVVAGSTLNLPNSIALDPTSTAQSFRVVGSGTLVLGGDNTTALAGGTSFLLGLGTTAGPTIQVANDAAFGFSLIDFQPMANAAVQSNNATARTLANPLRFSDTTLNQATFGAAGTGNLTFTGDVTMNGNVEASVQNVTTTLSGSISGFASLTKAGPGTLVLDGVVENFYFGNTTVAAGALHVKKDGGLGTGDVSVFAGATLRLELASSNDYISDDGRLLLGPGSPIVELAFTGSPDTIAALSFDGGNTFAAPGTWGAPGSGADFTNSVFVGTGTLLVIPEPGTAMSLLGGAGILLGLRRRKQ